MLRNPLTGVGLNRFLAIYGYEYYERYRWRAAHNTFIAVGAETGVLGLLAYLYLLYAVFRENYETRKKLKGKGLENNYLYYCAKALEGSLFAYCVGTVGLTAYLYIHLYFILALTLAVRRLGDKEIEVNSTES